MDLYQLSVVVSYCLLSEGLFKGIPLSGIYLVQPQPVYVDQRPDVKTKPPFLTAVVGAGRHRTPLYMVDTICFSEVVTKQLSGFSWSI